MARSPSAASEAHCAPRRCWKRCAVSATGAVITSAGIVLAAVFCVLGVLPLIVLTQVGIVVGLGILLDTFVVRTVVIPALFTLIGPRIWWPALRATR